LTVETRSEIFLTRVGASFKAAIIAQSAPIEVARSQAVRLGAATRRVSSRPWSICQSFLRVHGCAGGWPAIRVALAKAGVLTPLILPVAHRFRVKHQLPGLALLRFRVLRDRRVTYLALPSADFDGVKPTPSPLPTLFPRPVPISTTTPHSTPVLTPLPRPSPP
jgi:hypothetical protein